MNKKHIKSKRKIIDDFEICDNKIIGHWFEKEILTTFIPQLVVLDMLFLKLTDLDVYGMTFIIYILDNETWRLS